MLDGLSFICLVIVNPSLVDDFYQTHSMYLMSHYESIKSLIEELDPSQKGQLKALPEPNCIQLLKQKLGESFNNHIASTALFTLWFQHFLASFLIFCSFRWVSKIRPAAVSNRDAFFARKVRGIVHRAMQLGFRSDLSCLGVARQGSFAKWTIEAL